MAVKTDCTEQVWDLPKWHVTSRDSNLSLHPNTEDLSNNVTIECQKSDRTVKGDEETIRQIHDTIAFHDKINEVGEIKHENKV